jgi:hypothetical protein
MLWFSFGCFLGGLTVGVVLAGRRVRDTRPRGNDQWMDRLMVDLGLDNGRDHSSSVPAWAREMGVEAVVYHDDGRIEIRWVGDDAVRYGDV